MSLKKPIIIISETPFDEKFDWVLDAAKLDRREIGFVTLADRKVPEFKSLYLDRSCSKPNEELQRWTENLELELRTLDPNVIVPLGAHTLYAATGLQGISKWRGSIVESKWGSKVVPTFNMDTLNKDMSMKLVMLRDLRKVKSEAWHPAIIRPKRDFILAPSLDQVAEYLERVKKAGCTSVDIETQWYKDIACIGFSYEAKSAICIPFYDSNGRWFSEESEKQVRQMIEEVLSDPNIEVRGQNIHYDWCYLKRHGYNLRNVSFDTMVAHHAAWPELEKSLAFLASMYTKEPYWKDDGKDWRNVKDWPKFWRYNCLDVSVTEELVIPLKIEIKTQEAQETFDFEMGLVPRFVEQTLFGIRFDTEWRGQLKKETKQRIGELEREFQKVLPATWQCKKCKGVGEVGENKTKECPKCQGIGSYEKRNAKIKKCNNKTVQIESRIVDLPSEFSRISCKRCKGTGRVGRNTRRVCPKCNGEKQAINLSSPTQVKEVLKQLGFPAILKRNSAKETSDIEALQKLTAKFPKRPELKTLLEYSERAQEMKFLKTKIDSDGRIRTTLACNTETGRLNSKASPFGTGTNLQNIKHDNRFRKLFCADENYVLYGPDYSQAEARIVAYESRDLEYIQLFEANKDIHTENANTIFQTQIDRSTPEGDDMRQMGKRICHGLNYCMGIRTLCDYVLKEMGPKYAINEKQAKTFAAAYFERFFRVRQWQEETFEVLKATRTLTNCFGRKRTFLGRIDGQMHRIGVAFRPQSAVADLCNRAIRTVLEEFGARFLEDNTIANEDQLPIRFLLQIHDQLLWQSCKDTDTKNIMQRIIKVMTIPMTIHGITITIPVEMQIGPSWGELEKVK